MVRKCCDIGGLLIYNILDNTESIFGKIVKESISELKKSEITNK